jgi:RNA 3'-terminal phosphate cyclase
MVEIDGAQQSGSGTIVRYAVALAALLGHPLRLFNARAAGTTRAAPTTPRRRAGLRRAL